MIVCKDLSAAMPGHEPGIRVLRFATGKTWISD